MELDQFVSRLGPSARRQPGGYSALCPAHDDHQASLSISEGAAGILVNCHANCPAESVVAALGLTMADLAATPHIVEVYDYTDEAGTTVLYQVQRWSPKDFRTVNLPLPRYRVLYNQPAVGWARNNHAVVYVPEGEKTCDRLGAIGIPATCNVGGAGVGKWLPQYTETLAGMDVIVVADNDQPGREHARDICRQLKGRAASVRLARSRVGKDLDDALDAGWDLSNALEPMPDHEELGIYTAASIVEKPLRWAWPDYFAFGKLGILEGDPGGGKSLLSIDLAARWTTGTAMPDTTTSGGPFPVVMISAEDDAADTIKPRLAAAGANLELVHLVLHGATADQPFTFDELPTIEELIRSTGARALIIDPLMAFLGDNVDSHSDHSVRRALQPLKNLAARTEAALVLIRHLNKAQGLKAIYRGGGSIGFSGAARTVHSVVRGEDQSGALLCPLKNNLGPLAPVLGFRVDSAHGRPTIAWTGPVDISAQTAMDRSERTADPDDVDEVSTQRHTRKLEREFLLDLVADQPKPWADIVAAGRDQGFSDASMRRARGDLRMAKIYGERGSADITWSLPGPTVYSGGRPLTKSDVARAAKPQSPSAPPVTEELDDEERRDMELDALPMECGVCGTTRNCMRFAKPYWVVRCVTHPPGMEGVS
jgi:putative DNA primase/helicase